MSKTPSFVNQRMVFGLKSKILATASFVALLFLVVIRAAPPAPPTFEEALGALESYQRPGAAGGASAPKSEDDNKSGVAKGEKSPAMDGSGFPSKNNAAFKQAFNRTLKNNTLDIDDFENLHRGTFNMKATKTKTKQPTTPKRSKKSSQLPAGPVRDMRKYYQTVETENGTYYGPLDSKDRFCGTGLFYSKMASTYYIGGWCDGKKSGIGYTIKTGPGIAYLYNADYFVDGDPVPKAIYLPSHYQRMFSGMNHCGFPFLYLKCILTRLPEYGCPNKAVLAPSINSQKRKRKMQEDKKRSKTSSLFNFSFPKISLSKSGKRPKYSGGSMPSLGISPSKMGGGFDFGKPMSGFGGLKPTQVPKTSKQGKDAKASDQKQKQKQKSKNGGQESHSDNDSDSSGSGNKKGHGSQKGGPSSLKGKPSKSGKKGGALPSFMNPKKGRGGKGSSDSGNDASSESSSNENDLYKSSKSMPKMAGSASKLAGLFGPINKNLLPHKFSTKISKHKKKQMKHKLNNKDYAKFLEDNVKQCKLDSYCKGDLGYDANIEDLVKKASNAQNALKLKNKKFSVFECGWKGKAILMTISKTEGYNPGCNVYKFSTNKKSVSYVGSGGEVFVNGALGHQYIVEVGTISDTHERYMMKVSPLTEGKWAIYINDSSDRCLSGLKSHPVYFNDQKYSYKLLIDGECNQYSGTKIPAENQPVLALIGRMSDKLCPYLNDSGHTLTWPIIQGSSTYCNKPREADVTFYPNRSENKNVLMGTCKEGNGSCTYRLKLKTHYVNKIVAKLTGYSMYDSMVNPQTATIPRDALSLLSTNRAICQPRNHIALFKAKFPRHVSNDEDETNCLVVPFFVNSIVHANLVLMKLDPDIYLEMTVYDQNALSDSLDVVGTGFQAQSRYLPEHTYYVKIRSPKLSGKPNIFPGMESSNSKNFNKNVVLFMQPGEKDLFHNLRDTSAIIQDSKYKYTVHPLGNILRQERSSGAGNILIGKADKALCPYYNQKAGSITMYFTGSNYSTRDSKIPFGKVEMFCDADANSPIIDQIKRDDETFVHSFKLRSDQVCDTLLPLSTSLEDCNLGKSAETKYDKED